MGAWWCSIATSTYDKAATTSAMRYHHHDHLGGSHVETDDTGAVLEYMLYKPFGATLQDVQTGSYENDHKYTGKELDEDTSYYYYGARYYNAGYGRFLSQDPVFLAMGTSRHTINALRNPQYLNSYSYSINNPINYVDPDGQWPSFRNMLGGAAKAAGAFLNGVTSVTPIVSDYRDLVEVVTGYDMITGQKIGEAQKQLTGMMLVTPVLSGSLMRKVDDLADGAISGANRLTRNRGIANTIANGHAFDDHIAEFRGLTTREQFTSHLDNVMSNPTDTRALSNGRTGYWHESSGTVVVYNPNAADAGTAFVPPDGAHYFYNELD